MMGLGGRREHVERCHVGRSKNIGRATGPVDIPDLEI